MAKEAASDEREPGEVAVVEDDQDAMPEETEAQALALNVDGLRYWLREVRSPR